MSGFKFVNMVDYGLKDERYTLDLVPYCSNKVITMIKNMGYMVGMGLGKEGRGVAEFPNFKSQLTKEGLGFFEGCDGIKRTLELAEGHLNNWTWVGFPRNEGKKFCNASSNVLSTFSIR